MKHIKLLILGMGLIIFNSSVYAQTGIGTDNPHASSILDIQSTTKGLIIPRMTTAERDAIPSPAEGLEVFVTDQFAKFYFDGFTWQRTNKNQFSSKTQIYTFADVSTGSGPTSQGLKQVGGLSLSAKSIDATFAEKLDDNTIKILSTGTYVIELANFMNKVSSAATTPGGTMVVRKNGTNFKDSSASLGSFSTFLNGTSMAISFVADLTAGDLLTIYYQKVGATDPVNLEFKNILFTIRK